MITLNDTPEYRDKTPCFVGDLCQHLQADKDEPTGSPFTVKEIIFDTVHGYRIMTGPGEFWASYSLVRNCKLIKRMKISV